MNVQRLAAMLLMSVHCVAYCPAEAPTCQLASTAAAPTSNTPALGPLANAGAVMAANATSAITRRRSAVPSNRLSGAAGRPLQTRPITFLNDGRAENCRSHGSHQAPKRRAARHTARVTAHEPDSRPKIASSGLEGRSPDLNR